jgi:superfamily II helicase
MLEPDVLMRELADHVSKGVLETWACALPELNALQLSAVNDYGVLEGENIVVVAPTSSGKTMIGELAFRPAFPK